MYGAVTVCYELVILNLMKMHRKHSIKQVITVYSQNQKKFSKPQTGHHERRILFKKHMNTIRNYYYHALLHGLFRRKPDTALSPPSAAIWMRCFIPCSVIFPTTREARHSITHGERRANPLDRF